MSASTTAGIDCMTSAEGETIVSNLLPRRHAALMPSSEPMLKLISADAPASSIVQGRAYPSTSATDSG